MSFSSSYSNLRLTPNRCDNLFFCSPQNPFQIREFRVYRKRRSLKLFRSNPTLQSQFNFSFDNNVFQNLPSLDLLTPVLGLTSGVALYLSSRLNLASGGENNVCDIGEWILFTSPTPFNRFVILRCPSISFEGSELMEDVNERLVKEDRHFVRLNSGRMIQASRIRGEEPDELEYQRLCINTEDGGVISIDWPAKLDLSEEHGLDTTVLVVPGTAEGSMDDKVKAFVKEAVFCGFFPVVMNPRGCASSPLTTPRLFTAADSDDISTAIQFVNKARPWNTLMGVGWGYGANILTKYLAEAGEKTPLTAATCIDNPFDLEEATRLTPYHIALNEKLTGGLVDILRSNKELFLGRAKGFDVEKALSAKSVRDFDKAISMVSYGFEAIEDFYSKCSSRSLVGKVKIPVLYIQNDGGSVPLFSIPRGLIAENPFTSLLLCSCSSSRATVSWCHHLTIEWLTAVELGLLKGRHPLLKDVDITINPSKGFAFTEGGLTGKGGNTKKLLDLSRLNSVNGYSVGPRRGMLEDGDTAPSIHLQSRQDSLKDMELQEKGLHRVHNDMLAQSKPLEAELAKEEAELEDGERGQVLQTAQVAMNMLDVTMPGTLKEAEKQKVLAAVNQGETLLKALQDAVPEDVREKLTEAVSVIMHSQGTNLKQGIERIPKMQSGFKSKVHESVSDAHSTDEIKRTEGLADGTDNNQVGSEKATAGQGSESRPLDNMQSSNDVGQSQSISGDQGDISSSVRKDASETGKIHESDDLNSEKASLHADSIEPGSVTNVNLTTQDEKEGSTDEIVESKADPDGGVDRVEMKYNNRPRQKEEKVVDSLTDENNAAPSGSSEAQPEESERNDNRKKDLQHPPDQNKSTVTDSNAPTFNVSQALDALTGMDDSTQVAVNSVFGVLENMITQFEEEKEENGSHDGRELRTDNTNSVPETQGTFGKKEGSENDNKLRETEGSKDNQSMISDRLHDPPIHNDHGNSSDLGDDSTSERLEEESPESPASSEGNGSDDSQEQIVGNSLDLPINNDHIVGCKMVADYSYRPINSTPSYINASQYEDFLHSEYFQRYLLSKQTTKPLDVDTTTALLFDYFPEEGQWMLLEQPGENGDSAGDVTTHSREPEAPAAGVSKIKNYIEPSYVILDTERQHNPFGEFETIDNTNGYSRKDGKGLEELMQLVKVTILDSLRVEVDRRLSASDMEEMESQLAMDIETVATAVSLSIGDYKEPNDFEGKEYVIDNSSEKAGTVNGENVVRAISSAIQSTSYLRRVLPVGVIIGSSLAGLRKYFDLSTVHDEYISEVKPADETQVSREKNHGKTSIIDIDQSPVYETSQNGTSHSPSSKEVVETGLKTLNKDDVMVGAVTAALGASALLAPLPDKEPLEENETAESSSRIFKEKGHQHKEPGIPEGAVADKHQINMVTSLAEKALSVAGPVVPMKEDGELDQERLVAMLADLGQRGGVLRLVGKIALLWGGIRGAMSLTDRLITFLHIAERPLYQRILGFVSMVLVLWSFKLDSLGLEILRIAFPAALALAADPIASLIDTAFIGRIGPVELAAVGVSIAIFNQASRITIFPLVSITTSFVAEEDTLAKISPEAVKSEDLEKNEPKNNEMKELMRPEDVVAANLEDGPGAAATNTDTKEPEDGSSNTSKDPPVVDSKAQNAQVKKGKRHIPSVSTALILGLMLGLLQAICLVFGAKALLRVMGVKPDSPMLNPALKYLTLRSLGAPAVLLSLAMQGVFRGFKDTKTPLYATVAGDLTNIILDPIFIFVLKLGVSGAAIAHVLSQYLISLILLWRLMKQVNLLPPNMKDLQFGRFLKNGFLLLARVIAVTFCVTLAASMAARLGSTPMAAFQICLQVWMTSSLLADGLAVAGQAILACAFAEKDYKKVTAATSRVLQMSFVLGVGLAVVVGAGLYFGSGIFSKDASVLHLISIGVPFVAATQPINSIAFVFDGVNFGASDFAYTAYSMVFVAGASIASLFILSKSNGFIGIWVALTIYMVLRSFAGVLRMGTATGPWRFLRSRPIA